MMAEYIPLHRFKAIYVVDLCHSLCEQAKKKVQQKGWRNVHVVEGDACTFQPAEGIASLVTFSYSLSSKRHINMIHESSSSGLMLSPSLTGVKLCMLNSVCGCSDSTIPLSHRPCHLIPRPQRWASGCDRFLCV